MRTEKIKIKSNGEGFENALQVAEKFAAALGLSHKDALRLRLLMEETLGMIKEIVIRFKAKIWLESDEDSEVNKCSIHLHADTMVDAHIRQELLGVSTSGENMSRVGIMGKIRGLFELGMDNYENAFKLQAKYKTGYIDYSALGMISTDMSSVYYWSLNEYKNNLENHKSSSEAAYEAWDELEKSIVANLADEIKVGIGGDKVELIIEKVYD